MRYSVYEPDKEDWIKIFNGQSGGGTVAFYQGRRYQRGGSIGSFLGKLWRVIPKFLNSTIGQSLISGATEVAKDVAAGRSFKESAKSHGREQVRNLIGVGKVKRGGGGREGVGVLKHTRQQRAPRRTHYINAL